MVKSYQAAQKKPPKYTEQSLQVKDFMAKKLITFSPDDSMHLVTKTLVSKGISGAPVVDDKGNLVGVISEGDCLKQVVRGKYTNTPQLTGKVCDYMTPDPITIEPGKDILQAAQLFLKLRLRRFPVLDNGKLVGQISQRDVIAAIETLKNETW